MTKQLEKYKIKISIFVNFIVFFMIFFTWLSFFYFQYLKEKNYIDNKKHHIIKHINNIKNFKKVIDKLNDMSILWIVNDIVPWKIDNKILKNFFLSKYVYIKKNWFVEYKNFDIEDCKNKLECIHINKKKYQIVVWIKKNQTNYVKNIIWYALFSFFVSILFFPIIYWIVSRLTKPIENNFEFMKNFVNNAWHELKTPIANISLSSQILKQKWTYDNEIVDDIIEESNNISKLIDTLLQMSILSKFENKENINIKEIIEKILNEYKLELEWFKIDKQIDNVYKKINPFHIEILLRNLIKNAIKYNNEKKYIKISLNKDKLSIENSWKEIKNGEKKKIFELFYRIEKNKTWYGLGLAIVKKIVDINKWKIKVESKNGINKFIINF